jgi:hypothetical protein
MSPETEARRVYYQSVMTPKHPKTKVDPFLPLAVVKRTGMPYLYRRKQNRLLDQSPELPGRR